MGQNIAINVLNTAINSSHFAHVNGKSDRSTFGCAIVVNGTIFRCNGLETGELTRSTLRTKVERFDFPFQTKKFRKWDEISTEAV